MYRPSKITIVANGGKQQQADWNESDSTSPSFIKNKPDISGALTRQIVDELPTEDINPNCIYMVPDDDHYDEYMYINGNWEQIGSTQVEQVQSDWAESDVTSPAYIENKPTALSDFDNDENFITLNDVPQQVNSDWNASSGVSQILNKPTIPSATSDLTNDSGFITLNDVPAQVNSDWNSNSGVSQILNKPTIPSATSDLTNDSGFITLNDVPQQVNSDWNSNSGVSQILNKPTLASVATSGDYNDLSNKPTLATVATSGLYSDLSGTPSLSAVATSGDYDDLSNKPTIPSVGDGTITIQQNGTTVGTFTTNQSTNSVINLAGGGGVAQQQSDWTQTDTTAVDYIKNKPTLATVATSGDYYDLTNAPTVPEFTSALINDGDGQNNYYVLDNNLSSVAFSGDYDDLSNKPTIPAAQVNSDWNASSGVSQILNKPTLSAVATSGSYNDLSNTPTLATVATSGLYSDLSGTPTLATVATSGSYSDLSNTPSLASVATSGSYTDLSNTPTIPSATSDLTNDSGFITLNDVPAQVQSDWNESDTTDPAYIANKPTIPSVGNGTVSFYHGINNSLGSITMNQSGNASFDIKPMTVTSADNPATLSVVGGKVYKMTSNLTALTISTAEDNSVEALIYFHTNANGCTLTLPNTLSKVIGTTTLVADKDYIISIKDNVCIISNVSETFSNVAYSGSYNDLTNVPTNLVYGSLFGSPASYTIMYISQSDYDNLGTYDSHTIYMIY